MKCSNCPNDGVWKFETSGVDPIVFCNEHLPAPYRALVGTGVVSVVEVEAPVAPKKASKAAPVVEEPVVEEPVVEEVVD